MYLKQIQSISEWDFCKSEQVEDDEALYQFGFKNGIHFYLNDFIYKDNLGRFLISAWKDKKQVMTLNYSTFKEVVIEINKILNDNK
jgi:hypothetical protein